MFELSCNRQRSLLYSATQMSRQSAPTHSGGSSTSASKILRLEAAIPLSTPFLLCTLPPMIAGSTTMSGG